MPNEIDHAVIEKWTAFDKTEVFEAEIKPLIERVLAICSREQMPALASFCIIGVDAGNAEVRLVFKSFTQTRDGLVPSVPLEMTDVLDRRLTSIDDYRCSPLLFMDGR